MSEAEQLFWATVAKRIRDYRVATEVDRETCAKAMNVSASVFRLIESGQQRPSLYELFSLAGAFNLPLGHFLPTRSHIMGKTI